MTLASDPGVADPRIVPFGDAAVLVELGERIDRTVNERVHALARVLRETGVGAGIGEPVPGYASVLVPFDLLRTTTERVTELVASAIAGLIAVAAAPDGAGAPPPIEIAVRYGGAAGPDLPEVAERVGLSQAQVAELHASVVYRAYMLGFAPGFAYLGELPAELELPRRATPRQRVAPGSVAIAGRQTAVYPLASPGGWQLIGRTDVRMWDPLRESPALVTAGRLVRFVPA